MSLTMDLRPNRWIRSCLEDGSGFDYCSALGMGDFITRRWGIDTNDNNNLLSISVIPDPGGLIESIDTFPNATIYNEAGVSGSILSQTGSSTILGTTTYTYTPLLETGAGQNIFGTWSVAILGMQVTLKTGDVCSVNFNQVFSGSLQLAYEVTTTKITAFTIQQGGGSGFIQWNDGGPIEPFDATMSFLSVVHNFVTASPHVVQVFCDPTDITRLWIPSQDATAFDGEEEMTNLEEFDLSGNNGPVSFNFTSGAGVMDWVFVNNNNALETFEIAVGRNYGQFIRVHTCAAVTAVNLIGTNSVNISQLWIYSNAVLETLNLSTAVLLTQGLRVFSNPLLDTLTLPNISGTYTGAMEFFDNPTLPALDLSDFNFGATAVSISFFECDVLTSVTFPTSSGNVNSLRGYTCPALTTVDLSPLSGLRTEMQMNNCALTSFTPPTSTRAFTIWQLQGNALPYIDMTVLPNRAEVNTSTHQWGNNGMTATEVNHMLVDYDADCTGGFTGRSILIAGTNAAPDGSSGGYDGTTAKANLIIKLFTVTTN